MNNLPEICTENVCKFLGVPRCDDTPESQDIIVKINEISSKPSMVLLIEALQECKIHGIVSVFQFKCHGKPFATTVVVRAILKEHK